ncbi:AraC family transcriptional regulator [Lapidilactobacillus gannanensis]|uniref:Helix-turn-helix domain-containing protein n=1 Tax=Lapidilactobacillus gannanensis TaxID=2486002 RepID=A0ABW4BM01_9LACO|nr:AraC family transcriptional regulator [Lapidilactobacillus gannanensis]
MRVVFTQINNRLPLFLESIGADWQQEDVQRPTGYRYYHWLQTTSGQGIVTINDQAILLNRGTGILINPHVPHQYQSVQPNQWRTEYLTFGGRNASDLLDSQQLNYQLFNKNNLTLQKFIEKNGSAVTLTSDPNELSIFIYRFILLLNQARQENGLLNPRQHNLPILADIKQFLDRRYEQAISNEQLAARSGFTTQHLNRQFKQRYHATPLQYLTDLRLRKAQVLLISQPELSIEQVAIQTGFNSSSYFIAQFHRQTQLTPRQFRQLH